MIKVSIITVSFNSSATISETIDSVLAQCYPNIEYIVMDGDSTDGTQEIIKSYGSKISHFFSERDDGLYHAMNKAIALASGDIVGILNSDDVYASTGVLSSVVQEFESSDADCVFGDLVYFSSNDPQKVIRRYSGKRFSPEKVRIGILPPHPTFFVKRKVYEEVGTFDLQFIFAADFDLMVRILCVHNRPYSYLPLLLVRMRLGGISTGSLRRLVQINREDIRSCKKNGIRTNMIMFHVKYLFKVFSIRSFSVLFGK